MMIPKISVIIPAYNAEKYIAKAIDSILKQTEKSIEAIVVDDGSSDATVEVVKSFSDRRLRLIINQSNCGVSYSRNRALQEAKGEWIALLDADDWYAPERIEKLLQVAGAEDVDMIADDVYFMQNDAKEPIGTLLCVDQENFNTLRFIDPVTFIELSVKPASLSPNLGLAKPLIKRSFLLQHNLKYDEKLHYCEDFNFYLLCLLKGAKFVISPEPYYFYRRYSSGAASAKNRLKRLEQGCQAILHLLEQKSVQDNPNVLDLISNHFIKINQELQYHTAIQNIKERRWLEALRKMVSNPKLIIYLLKKVWKKLENQFI